MRACAIAEAAADFAAWVSRVERYLRDDIDIIDGDQQRDGYSLDHALEAFCSGQSASDYALAVQATRSALQ